MSLNKTLGQNGWEVEGINEPGARFAMDASGNVTGLVHPGTGETISLAKSGLRCVLFGDSMTDWYSGVTGITGITYSQATGILSFTTSFTHGLVDGHIIDVFSHNYASLRSARKLPITRTAATTFTVMLTDKPTDIPNGSVTTPVFIHLNNRHEMQSFVHWWQLNNSNALNIVNNAAKSGNMAGFTYDILDAEVIDYHPDIVIGQMPGINDSSDSQTYSYAETLEAQKAIIDKLSSAVPIVVLGTMTPVYTGESRATLGTMSRVVELNKEWTEYARSKPNVFVFDPYSVIVDPTNTTGLAKAGHLGADNIHYHAKGAIKAYKELDKVLSKLIPATAKNTLPKSTIDAHTVSAMTVSSMSRTSNVVTVNSTNHRRRVGEMVHVTGATPSDANTWSAITSITTNSFTYDSAGTDGSVTGATVSTTNNIFPNSLLLTTTGGVVGGGFTGTAADGFACSPQSGTPVAVASVAAAASGYGNEQVLTVSAAVLDDRVKIDTEWVGTFGNRMIPGRKYDAEFNFRINSANWANTPLSELYFVFSVVMSDGVTSSSVCLSNWDGTSATTIEENMTLNMKFDPIKIPNNGATVSLAGITCYVRAGGTWSSNVTLGMSQVAVRIVE